MSDSGSFALAVVAVPVAHHLGLVGFWTAVLWLAAAWLVAYHDG